MREKMHCCPNCDTVMVLRYEPDEADRMVYECFICGHRAEAEGFRSGEAERLHGLPYAHKPHA